MAAVDDLLTCAVCLGWFRSPRRLPCLHVYCLECLRGLVVHGTDKITCPECRRDHVIPNGTVEDFPIDGRLEQFMEAQNRPPDWCKDCKQESSVGECDHCQLPTCLQCQSKHRDLLVASLIHQWRQFHNEYFSDDQMVAREKQKNELLQHKENIEAVKTRVNQEIDDMIEALEIRRLALITRSEKKEHFIEDELLKLQKVDVISVQNLSYITRLIDTSSLTKGVVSMKEEIDEQIQFMTSLQSGHNIKKPLLSIGLKEKQELLKLIDKYCQISIDVDYRNDFTIVKTIDGSESGVVSQQPNGLSVCPYTDDIYVTDDTNISVYDSEGAYIRHTNTNVSSCGIAIDSKRRVIVTSWRDDDVKIYRKNLEMIKSFGLEGKENGQFIVPHGVACDQDDNIYVVDNLNHRVQVFTPDGAFLSVIGRGRLQQPWYIQINQQQEVMVTNGSGVDIFHRNGAHLRTITGEGENKLKSPTGICMDATGHILVADYRAKKIQVYTADGTHYCTIDQPAAAMVDMCGLAVTASGVVFITDTNGNLHLVATI